MDRCEIHQLLVSSLSHENPMGKKTEFHIPTTCYHLPSGKRLHNYGKSPFLMGKSTIRVTDSSTLPKLVEAVWISELLCMFTRGYHLSKGPGPMLSDLSGPSQVPTPLPAPLSAARCPSPARVPRRSDPPGNSPRSPGGHFWRLENQPKTYGKKYGLVMVFRY